MSSATIAPDAQAALQQRIAELQRRHPNSRRTDTQLPDEPPVVPSSARTCSGIAAPAITFNLRLDGEVLTDAAATTERGTSNAMLTVVLQQRGGGLPVVATRRYSNTPISHTVAHSIAKRLKAGTPVHVEGKGLRLADHDGQQMLRVLDVQAIDPPTEPATRKDLE